MIDNEKRDEVAKAKERVRNRVRTKIDPDNYEYIPAKKQIDYYDNDVHQRVAVYARVSTESVSQTNSFELQKKYYEDFVVRHPKWTLVKIYADEGISGTSLKKRDQFNEMIADCKAGKIDMIITKSVSRFARNVVICIGIVRDLAEMNPPVGVFFESECIFSLKEESQMALSFQATMAEEESHTRSRSMESSLRMRLDNGIPLTPKLLGYLHDSEGNLIINPEEAPTVKLAFYMYLYGYSTQQIADAFNALGRKSYLGNINWTPGGIVQILRNERHCGDVLTRKTYTPNFRDHLSKKNRGQRPQSRYLNHHEAIISRDDFNAVQRMIDNAKYGNKSFLPELRVIDSGLLKGFVSINPRWAGFKDKDYYLAARSVYGEDSAPNSEDSSFEFHVDAGDFDLRGFEITRSEFFDSALQPAVSFAERRIKFNATCVHKFGPNNHIELLVNPITQRFAIRPTDPSNRNSVLISNKCGGKLQPRDIPSTAYRSTLFSLFGWNTDYKYRIIGKLYERDNEVAFIFDIANSEAYFKPYILPQSQVSDSDSNDIHPFLPSGKYIRAIPEAWTTSFGSQFYKHEQDTATLEAQSEADWKLRLEGRLFESGKRLNVTGFDELRQYIAQSLSEIKEDNKINE